MAPRPNWSAVWFPGSVFKGVMVSGTTDGPSFDDQRFYPVLAEAERLDVPIYLHPAPPPPERVQGVFLADCPTVSALLFLWRDWGWHAENGLHSLRLVVAGVFDRFPKVELIIGHMGENIPFSLARADVERLSPAAPYLQRRVFRIISIPTFILPPADISPCSPCSPR